MKQYSGKNPVPRVAHLFQNIANPKGATDSKARHLAGGGAKKKQQDSVKQNEVLVGRLKRGKEMSVRDPVTGDEITIKNPDEVPESIESMYQGQNVLTMEIPPPDWSAHTKEILSTSLSTITTIVIAFVFSFTVFYLVPGAIFNFHSRPISAYLLTLVPPALISFVAIHRLRARTNEDFQDRAYNSERVRGLRAGTDTDGNGHVDENERIKESAEWANALLRGIWPIMNPDLFSSIPDLLEDVMQASVPVSVHSVRVADLGTGENPPRIMALRSLPDADDAPGKELLKKGENEEGSTQEQPHVNLEASFAYRALPSSASVHSKARNAHLLVEFTVGIKGLCGFRVPVWCEMTGCVGSARARLELIPDPPFVKQCTLTLLGVPTISISVVPLAEKLPLNVMNIPLISTWISNCISTAVAEYVAPKSLNLDLQRLIVGDDVKKDAEAIGVIIVHIHRAQGIKKMDNQGSSVDPYVTLCFSRLGTPLFSTRIIKNQLNPIFEETAAILLDANTIKVGEELSLQVWDSDRMSADDVLGKVDVSLQDLVSNPSKPLRQTASLTGMDKGTHRPGNISFTAGFYPKLPPTTSLRTDGFQSSSIPASVKDDCKFKDVRGTALNDLEAAVLVTPPDPAWPSGILSVQVHEIRELKYRDNEGTFGREKGLWKVGQSNAGEGEEEEAEGLPSSYCVVSLNDERIYKTRTKPITATPFFNAGTERFIRDWRTSHVSVVVRDSRMRENNPILGMALLKLSEVFVDASQVTRFYSLEKGVAYGQLRVSLMFRPVSAKLPRNLLGFDTGTIHLQNVNARIDSEDTNNSIIANCELRLQTSSASDRVPKEAAEEQEDDSVAWDQKPAKMPVQRRYGTALVVKFRSKNGLGMASTQAVAALWLRDVVDSEDTKVRVPLWDGKHHEWIAQNYYPSDLVSSNLRNQKEEKEVADVGKRLGWVELEVMFKPGLSDEYRDVLDHGGDRVKEQSWEEYDGMRAGGLRENAGKMPPGDELRGREDGRVESHPDENTAVEPDDESVRQPEDESEYHDDDSSNEDGGGHMFNIKKWMAEQRELGREHRGVMQSKGVRTAVWANDGVKKGVDKVKKRFAMKERKPALETEV